MSIVRIKKSTEYFVASNVPFTDKRLSWEARGMIGYLLSKPDNWTIRIGDLENQSEAGGHKVRRILKELEENGYLERKRIRNSDGTFYWLSTIYETPAIYQLSTYGSSTYGSSIDGQLQDIDITESINTELKKTEIKSTPAVKAHEPDDFEAMKRIIQSVTGVPPFGADSIKAINDLIEMQATEDDIKAGYNWYLEQGKKFRYYGSIIGAVRTAQAKRLAKPLGKVYQAPPEVGHLPIEIIPQPATRMKSDF